MCILGFVGVPSVAVRGNHNSIRLEFDFTLFEQKQTFVFISVQTMSLGGLPTKQKRNKQSARIKREIELIDH